VENSPRVKSVEALSGKRLRIAFDNGAVQNYDCNPLLDLPAFRDLKDDAFFRNVQPDTHGYGIIWNDDVDLAESELWINGTTEPTAEGCAAISGS
jgi:hypothetical protein